MPHDPAFSSSPPPFGAGRDPGDAWAVGPDGERFWGRFGAAGLVVHRASADVLLQHRARWSHHGGTWGIPGGARHEGEGALDAAVREAHEEAGVPRDALAVCAATRLDLGFWSYTTVVASATREFTPAAGDAESMDLQWVPTDAVTSLPLHPGFAAAWPRLRPMLGMRPVVIVDAANVVGSRPDGWWRDRAGAATRLGRRVATLAERGMDGALLGLAEATWYPQLELVVEGAARSAELPDGVSVTRASGHGDDAIVDRALARVADGASVTVVTSDRELADRVTSAGARTRGASWLLDQLPED